MPGELVPPPPPLPPGEPAAFTALPGALAPQAGFISPKPPEPPPVDVILEKTELEPFPAFAVAEPGFGLPPAPTVIG